MALDKFELVASMILFNFFALSSLKRALILLEFFMSDIARQMRLFGKYPPAKPDALETCEPPKGGSDPASENISDMALVLRWLTKI